MVQTAAPASVAATLQALRDTPWLAKRIVHEEILPAQEAVTAPWPEELHPVLRSALAVRGMNEAYSHQAEAIGAAIRGRDVVVVTPTASGKSLCYTLPVLDTWLRDPSARALWLFPTKALAQDQLASLQELTAHLPEQPRVATYDGDTPPGIRRAVRDAGHVVVTNPDMLHSGILPHHTGWVRLFQNLRYVVIDELHAYRGLFGSHLGNVLRRLQRLCNFYGSDPVFILCSATIGNPGELAEKLTERSVHLVGKSGAPRAERRLWFWNPPQIAATVPLRRSAVLEARRLVDELMRRELQTIAFTRSRSSVEVLLTYLRRLHPGKPGSEPLVRGYRGGYLPLQRRAIEAGLRDGSVRTVVSTNALELGIDIGNLDACVMVGYPGSVASTWQQLGRAGRRDSASLGVFIATDSPIDQYIVKHPEFILDQPAEQARVDPDNLLVVGSHIQAAAFELAFESGERFGTYAETAEMLDCLAADGLLHHTGRRYHWAGDAFPTEAVSLRRAAASNVVIIDTSTHPDGPGQGPQGPWAGSGGGRPGSHGRVIGEVDQFTAPVLVHDDAIYLHEGVQFHVERLDWEEKRAYVHPVSVDHYTLAETRQKLSVLERYAGPDGAHCRKAVGEVRVSRLATMYKKVRFLTHENIGTGPIMLPEQDLHTTAFWMAFSQESVASMSRAELDSGLSGLASVLHGAACLLCMCDPRDLGSHSEMRGLATPPSERGTPEAMTDAVIDEPVEHLAGWRPQATSEKFSPAIGLPTVYVYDSVAGGVGFAEGCHSRSAELVAVARRLVESCVCDSGCPSCVGPGSGEANGRAATLRLLDIALREAV